MGGCGVRKKPLEMIGMQGGCRQQAQRGWASDGVPCILITCRIRRDEPAAPGCGPVADEAHPAAGHEVVTQVEAAALERGDAGGQGAREEVVRQVHVLKLVRAPARASGKAERFDRQMGRDSSAG